MSKFVPFLAGREVISPIILDGASHTSLSRLMECISKSSLLKKHELYIRNLPVIIAIKNINTILIDDHTILTPVLSSDELVRRLGYRNNMSRRHFVLSRLIVRTFASKILNLSPDQIPIVIGSRGKPSIPNSYLKFNISHSGDVVMVAFHCFQDVGVDIEVVDYQLHWEAIALDLYSKKDWFNVQRLPRKQQLLYFYQLWTTFESAVKTIGIGLSFLDEIKLGSISTALDTLENNHDFINYDINSLDGYVGCCSVVV